MAGEKDKRSDPRKAPLAANKVAPSAALHAKVLVSSYGAAGARDIARVNASLDRADPYWSSVLQAIGQIESRFRGP